MENSCNSFLPVVKGSKSCNCKYSKCLKLYCECFSSGDYCVDCNCTNCHNNPEHEETRNKKVKTILSRDPLAFRPKIPLDPSTLNFSPAPHFKGCNCKKTKCVKKYCECFNAGILCSETCNCSHCKNKVNEVSKSKKSEGALIKYFKVLSGGLAIQVENEDYMKSEDSSTFSDESSLRLTCDNNYEKFESVFYKKILEILNRNRAF